MIFDKKFRKLKTFCLKLYLDSSIFISTIEEVCSFCTVLFTVLFYHIKNTQHKTKQFLAMVALFISKTEITV